MSHFICHHPMISSVLFIAGFLLLVLSWFLWCLCHMMRDVRMDVEEER